MKCYLLSIVMCYCLYVFIDYYRENYLPVLSLEPGTFWWLLVTLTTRLTGITLRPIMLITIIIDSRAMRVKRRRLNAVTVGRS